MILKRCKPHAILALFVTIIFHDAIAAGALPIELRQSRDPSKNAFKSDAASRDAHIHTRTKQPSSTSSQRATHPQSSVPRKTSMHVDVNAAERSHQRRRSLKVTAYSDDALSFSESSADKNTTTSLVKRGGGKGMDRHLAAASFAAMLAVGTAGMGVATYMLRLNDWKKYKKPAFKKGTKEMKKLEAQDKSEKGKKSSENGKVSKDDNDPPDSPASPSSPQNVFFITNNYNAPAEQAARQTASEAKEGRPCNNSNASTRLALNNTANGIVPHLSVHKRALLRPPSGSGVSLARATTRVRVRPPARGARQLRHRQGARAAQTSSTTAENSGGSHRPEPFPTTVPDDSGPPTVSRGLLNLKKFDKWAPLAAKIEDYGKVSAATGAFLAGAVSLYTSASEHHEYRKLDKDGNGIKDDDEDKNGNGVRDGDEDEDKDDDEGSDDESDDKVDKKGKDKRSDEDALDAGRGCDSSDNSTQHITITIH